jgi:hypothetical protein
MNQDDFADLNLDLSDLSQETLEVNFNPKLEKRRRIEEIFEEKKLRQELEDIFCSAN